MFKQSNFLRRYEDKEEFELALEKRKEEFGEGRFEDTPESEEDYESEDEDIEDEFTEDSDNF